MEKQVDDLHGTKNPTIRLSALQPFLIGFAGAICVVGFYLGLLTLTSDWYNARLEFGEYGLWILALAGGLGVQATLYALLRKRLRGTTLKGAKGTLAASGGMSASAMAACCAHYLVSLLPALSLPFLSAAAAGLARYQTVFFLVGVLSNFVGIGLMVRMMKKAGIVRNGRAERRNNDDFKVYDGPRGGKPQRMSCPPSV